MKKPNIIRSPTKAAAATTTLPGSVEARTTSAAFATSAPSNGSSSSRRKPNMSHTLVESHTEIIINGKRVEEADIIKRAEELRRQEEEERELLKPIRADSRERRRPPESGTKVATMLRLSNSNLKVCNYDYSS